MVSILHCALIVITNGMRAIFAAACPGVLLHHMRSVPTNSSIGRVQRAEIRGHAGRQSGTWRKPRQPEHPPPNVASSSSGGNPVKLELIAKEQAEVHPNGVKRIDELTALDSDELDASIFGLSAVLHDGEVIDKSTDVASQESDEVAVAERERVSKWRTDNLLLDDLDFAYVYADFEEAYSHAGEAVAMAWSRARFLAMPEMVSDMAKISAVEATATRIHRGDKQRRAAVTKREKTADASFLRQPGRGTELVG